MKFLNFTILFIFILSSCKETNPKLEKLLKPPVNNRENLFEIYLADQLNIPIPDDKFSSYSEYAIYNDSLFYGVHFTKPLTIDVYNLSKQEYSYSIEVPEYLVKTKKIKNLFIQSPDSIFFLESYPMGLSLINSEGSLIKKFKINELSIQEKYAIDSPLEFVFPTLFKNDNPVFLKQRDEMYMIIHPLGAEILPGYENIERIGVYDIKTESWKRFIAKPEGILKEKDDLCYPWDLSLPYFQIVDRVLYITYPMDHYIYAYDIDSGKLLFTKPGNGKDISEITYPVKLSKIKDHQYGWNYRVQTLFYGPLLYDRSKNMFTRQYNYSQDLKNKYGKINNGEKRIGSIIIFDSLLNIVGETTFTNGRLGVLKTIPLSNGLLIGDNEFNTVSDDTLIYRNIFKIRPINPKTHLNEK